jgi:hypothetical protein
MDLEEDSFELALEFEQIAKNKNAMLVVKACCWILAGQVVEASRRVDVSLDEGLRATQAQIVAYVAHISAADALPEGRVS